MIIRLVSYNCGWIRRAEHAPSSLGLLVPHQLTLARCGLRTAGITVQTEAKLAVHVDFLTGKVWQQCCQISGNFARFSDFRSLSSDEFSCPRLAT